MEKHADKTALIFVDEERGRMTWSFRELFEDIQKIANCLNQNKLEKSSRVVIRLSQSPEYAILFFASVLAGYITVPTSPQLTNEEENFILEDSKASLLVYSDPPGKPDKIPQDCIVLSKEELFQDDKASSSKSLPFYETEKEDPAFLVYTSGTTGYPKGVLHAHRNILGRTPMRDGWTDLQPSDRLLHAGQMNWTYTFGVGLMDTWTWGATSVLYNGKNEPKVWADLIHKEKPTIFVTVPGLYRRILKYTNLENYDLSSLRHCLTAGSALHPELREKWKKATNTYLYEALGMSEISTYVSTSPKITYKPGSPGTPQKGRQICILPIEGGTQPLPPGEVGLIAIHRSDPGLMLKYWNSEAEEEKVFRGDWFVGGDLAYMDEDDYIYYHGRNDELMNSFGYRVSPLEIERILSEHTMVMESAVTEVRKSEDISVIAAFVVLKGNAKSQENAEKDIMLYLSEKLAKYKLPREIHFVPELPHNKNGKLLRKNLNQLLRSSFVSLFSHF